LRRRAELHFLNCRSRWLAFSFVILALSVTGAVARASGCPEAMPSWLAFALDQFIEPGAAAWWFTMGGVFQAFPSTAAGYLVVPAMATAAAW